VKVDKQQFEAVVRNLLATPPLKKVDIAGNAKRGRPRKNRAARPAKKP
jgi:hypothetical protein